MNTLLSRTLADEPLNEKAIRGLESAFERFKLANEPMIASVHAYCDQVDRMMN